MSALDSIGTTTAPGSSTDAFNALTSGQFLQIIFTELTNQDPLAPNDTQSMLNQLSTLRSIQSDTQIVDSLKQMVSQSELASASQLIGSLVSGITLDNRRVADLVISVSMTPDGPVLNMFDGSRMFFRNVDEIVGPIDPPIDPNSDPNTDPDTGDGTGDGTGSTNIPLVRGSIDPNHTGSTTVGSSTRDPSRRTVSNDV